MTLKSASSEVLAYWSRWAKEYDVHQGRRLELPGEFAAWQQVWAPALPAPGAEILDVGTGTGHAAFVIASLGHQVTGIDLSEGMLARARERVRTFGATGGHRADKRSAKTAQPRVTSPRFLYGDAADPPWPPETFDALTARYVLWTMPDPVAVLRRWAKVIRPGGHLAVVDSPWFPDGMPAFAAANGTSERTQHFHEAYQPVLGSMSLAEARHIGPFTESVEQAGFVEVEVEPLDEIERLDTVHGVAEGHAVQRQFRITARNSWRPRSSRSLNGVSAFAAETE